MTVMLNLKPDVEANTAQKAATGGRKVSDYLAKMTERATTGEEK